MAGDYEPHTLWTTGCEPRNLALPAVNISTEAVDERL